MPKDTLTSTKFVGKISPMGDKLIIIIPKDFHKEVEKMKGKQVRVVVDNEF